MTGEHTKKLRRIYGIALSCVIILAGICLMVACVGIYLSGDAPFSRQSVADAFSPIAIPVYLCLILVIAGFVLNLISPQTAAKVTAIKQPAVTLKRLHARADFSSCSSELKAGILAQQKRRRNISRICALILGICALVFLVYALDSSHFHSSEINRSMISAMTVLLPCLVVSFATCVFTVRACGRSILREIELLKQCPKAAQVQEQPVKAASLNACRYALLIAALALAIFGFCTGGTADVLTKAVNICTECIGLG